MQPLSAQRIAATAIRHRINDRRMHVGLYNGSLTREQFMFREMRIVARLYKNGLSNAEITDTVYRDNLFQYPT